MNWNAIGAIGEVVGAIAVVVSLLYISLQIRRGTKAAEDAAFRDVFAATGDHMRCMVEQSNRQIILKGLVNYSELSSDEKFAFDGLFGILFVMVESTIISNAAELVRDGTMDNWGYYMRTRYFSYDGTREWWEDSKYGYIPELQAWIGDQMQQADRDSDYWGIK